MRIKDVEALVGIAKKNIRFYEEAGLLTPGRSAENSYRDYTMDDVERLLKIKLLRKLDMPVSEIRELLDGALSLPVAARRHDLYLEERMESISQARAVCKSLSDAGAGIAELDAAATLAEMENMEREGVRFVDVEKRDVRKKYTGPVASCAVIVALMCGVSALLLWLGGSGNMPLWAACVLLVFPVAVCVGCIAALITRIREIQGGEENDLSNY